MQTERGLCFSGGFQEESEVALRDMVSSHGASGSIVELDELGGLFQL